MSSRVKLNKNVILCLAMKQPRLKGKFGSPYNEPQGEPIAFRLPISLDRSLREIAGDDLKGWVKQAITEKLARENQQDCA